MDDMGVVARLVISAAVGAESGRETAVMVLTADAPVRASTINRIVELDGI